MYDSYEGLSGKQGTSALSALRKTMKSFDDSLGDTVPGTLRAFSRIFFLYRFLVRLSGNKGLSARSARKSWTPWTPFSRFPGSFSCTILTKDFPEKPEMVSMVSNQRVPVECKM